MVAALMMQHAQQIVGVGMIGLGLQNPAVYVRGFLELARLMRL